MLCAITCALIVLCVKLIKRSEVTVILSPVSVCVQLIGKSRVAVPSHLYKVILAVRRASCWATANQVILATYLVPNRRSAHQTESQPYSLDKNKNKNRMDKYVSSVEFIESQTGLKFFPKFDRSKIVKLDKLLHPNK